jgi:predicted HTH domain antitoxin
MKTLVLNLPNTVELDDKEAALTIAAKLYEKGKLSLGQAAELAGLSKRAFIEIIGNYGVSVFNYSVADLHKDIENAKNYHF